MHNARPKARRGCCEFKAVPSSREQRLEDILSGIQSETLRYLNVPTRASTLELLLFRQKRWVNLPVLNFLVSCNILILC
jgi:hypothetical protein